MEDDDSVSSHDPLIKVEVNCESSHAEENGVLESGSNTFKIVQTIEDGKLRLWTVPKAWESGGLLRWPRFKVGKLRRDPLSKPTDSWPITNCILIKSDLVSFEFAETVIRYMNDTSDVEEISEVPTNGDTIQPLKSHDLAQNKSKTFNRKVDIPTTPKEVPVETEPEMEDFASILVIPAENHRSSSFQPKKIVLKAAVTQDTSATTQYSEISSKIDTLCALVTAIAQDQQVLVKNQEIILNKISVLTQRFEKYSKQSLNPVMQFSPGNLNNCPSTREIKKICNQAELDELEQSLKDATTAAELRETYSVVCGKGKGRGINNAYTLVDFMFDRDFLTQCSWTGGSRTLDSKVCFKSYTNVIIFFFQIVHASDRRFTQVECHEFFKQVLKNSIQRAKTKQLRTSLKRKRLLKKKRHVGNGERMVLENEMNGME